MSPAEARELRGECPGGCQSLVAVAERVKSRVIWHGSGHGDVAGSLRRTEADGWVVAVATSHWIWVVETNLVGIVLWRDGRASSNRDVLTVARSGERYGTQIWWASTTLPSRIVSRNGYSTYSYPSGASGEGAAPPVNANSSSAVTA